MEDLGRRLAVLERVLGSPLVAKVLLVDVFLDSVEDNSSILLVDVLVKSRLPAETVAG